MPFRYVDLTGVSYYLLVAICARAQIFSHFKSYRSHLCLWNVIDRYAKTLCAGYVGVNISVNIFFVYMFGIALYSAVALTNNTIF